jgi:hypothetical protein
LIINRFATCQAGLRVDVATYGSITVVGRVGDAVYHTPAVFWSESIETLRLVECLASVVAVKYVYGASAGPWTLFRSAKFAQSNGPTTAQDGSIFVWVNGPKATPSGVTQTLNGFESNAYVPSYYWKLDCYIGSNTATHSCTINVLFAGNAIDTVTFTLRGQSGQCARRTPQFRPSGSSRDLSYQVTCQAGAVSDLIFIDNVSVTKACCT